MSVDLYHNRVLELASAIPCLGRLEAPHGRAERTSRICGSTVAVDVRLASDGETIEAIAVDPKACALGQAAAAILTDQAVGASAAEIEAARDGLKAMLKHGAEPPQGRFWELRHLAGVADYPTRHASTLLAFDAAVDAIAAAKAARITT
ncbi:MAG: iron-sulfur cluster assembly scaffold protein [Pseudomonadota bacterium]